MKKYLKTIEDIEALRNTDTKIYREYQSSIGYYKFVNGVLCSFTTIDELLMYNAGLSWNIQEYYIKVEDERQEDNLKEAVELLEVIATHTCMEDSDVRKQLKEVYGWASDFLDRFNDVTEGYSKHVGKLGWFWDGFMDGKKFIDVLESIDKRARFKYKSKSEGEPYQFFQPLTHEEVEKYIGYKVEDKK